MKKIVIALSAVALTVIACSPKAAKTETGSVTAGEALFSSAKCTKCHKSELHEVPEKTFEEQEKLLLNMSVKAKLTYAEVQDLMAYVKANAKK